MTKLKFLFHGFDGMDYNSLNARLDDLPHFHRMVKQYHSMKLTSVYKSTAPSWQGMYTGKSPDQYWKSPPKIWEVMALNNYKVGVMNMPATFPPSRIAKGFMISGFPVVLGKPITFPKRIATKKFNENYCADIIFKVMPSDYAYDGAGGWRSTIQNAGIEAIMKTLEQIESYRTELAIELVNKYKVDILFYQQTFIDHLIHVWGMDKQLLPPIYALADKHFSKLYNKLKPKKFMVVSDHGMADNARHSESAVYLSNIDPFANISKDNGVINEVDIFGIMVGHFGLEIPSNFKASKESGEQFQMW